MESNGKNEKLDMLVLYVEDEDSIREVMAAILRRRFKELITASNGQEGLYLYKERHPDLIITDIRMPLMTGLELAKEIRLYDNNTQIIVTSAHSDTEYFIDSIELGINHYVLKPVDKILLFKAIERCCSFINMRRDRERLAAELKISEINLRHRNDQIERDLEKARILQNELLPQNINTKWIKSDYRYLPFDKIGGDFFSFNNPTDDSVNLFVGDVTGHGVSAAIFVSLIKVLTDRIYKDYNNSPIEYLLRLNQDLIDIEIPSFITALSGNFTITGPSTVNFQFSVGGHPPPLIYRNKTKKIEIPETKGMIVGSFETTADDFDNISVSLETGDRVFLYTDGIVESKTDAFSYFDVDIFANYLETIAYLPYNEILDTVMNKLKNHKVSDDALLIVFEIL